MTRIGMRIAAAAAVTVITGCGLPGAGPGAGVAAGTRGDHVVIGGYGEVVAMATSERMVFLASPSGLATYDRVAQHWLPPLTEADGYPAGRITAIAGDPGTEGVWIAALGEVLFYRPAIDQLIRTIVAGRTDRIFFDRGDPSVGAYVGAGDQWTRVSPGGFSFAVTVDALPPQGRRIASPSFESLAEEMPALRSFSGLLTRDAELRSWRPTSAARVDGMSEIWLGTMGGGVYRADPLFNRAQHLPYGLFEEGAGPLSLASDGVWAAALGSDQRGTGGVTFAGTDLQRWRWVRGPADGSLAGIRVLDMLVRDGRIWLATDRGVATVDVSGAAASGERTEWQWAELQGRRRALSLAAFGGRIWVGTEDGLVAIANVAAQRAVSADADAGVDAGTGMVGALLAAGDSLWIGGAGGLGVMRVVDGAPTVTRQAIAGAPVWLRQPVVALARSDSLLFVVTREQAGMVHPGLRSGLALPGNPDLRRLGFLTSIAVDARTIWIGGQRGAVVIDRATGIVRRADAAGMIPDIVIDIALQPGFAWLSTPAGLMRVERGADGGVR